MSKLIRNEVGANSNLVTAVQDDKEDSFSLSQAINNFIQESKKETGSGKVLDAEIWNNVRDRFSQCLVANNNRRIGSATLTDTINSANQELNSYIGEAPIPEDPDTDRIGYYKNLANIHYNLYIYFKTHKTKFVGYETDMYGNEVAVYDYDYDAIATHYAKWQKYKAQQEWLERLVPTDNSVTYKVSLVDLSGMTVKAS